MRARCIALAFVSWVASASAARAADWPQDGPGWAAAARQDIEAGYKVFLDNHPGVYDVQNPGFRAQLQTARDLALALAPKVVDSGGFDAAISVFVNSLQDGHAQGAALLAPSVIKPARWPGFVAAWRGQGLFVFAAAKDGPPVASRIESCDGFDVRKLILSNVFRFHGRPAAAGQWWVRGRYLFRDDGNPFVTLPRTCVFSRNGKHWAHSLPWRPADAQFESWFKASNNGDIPAPGLTQPAPGLYWMALPTFEPDDAARAAYRAAFDSIEKGRAGLLAARALVIDLRGNQGGSTDWPVQFSRALWGKEAADALAGADPSEVWWRASPGNTEYIASLVPILRGQGEPEMAQWAAQAAARMRAALDKGEKYAIDPPEAAPAAGLGKTPPLPHGPPIYVIVPGQCASACLDALDLFARFPRAKRIGAPSSADTNYLEVRHVTLPGGRTGIGVPTKLYRHRPRASGQIYTPAIEVDDIAWSSADFLRAIEQDLRGTPLPRR